MSNTEEFDLFMDSLLSNAVQDFKATEQYRLLQEKLDRMDRDCESMFTKDEQDFAIECFELLLDVSGQEEKHVYQRGLLDCVCLLKRLGVLA